MKLRANLFWEATQIAFQSIWGHKLRNFLTLLGIIIGVASVMVVGAAIKGAESYVLDTVSKTLGSNSFVLSKFGHVGQLSEEEWERIVRRNKDLLLEDVDFVEERCSDCSVVSGEITSRHTVYYGAEEMYNVRVGGVTENIVFLRNLTVVEGRFFSRHEEHHSRFVCVIGRDLKEKFFPNLDALGREIKIRNERLQVIGVLEKLGSAFGVSLDSVVYLPITTYRKIFGSRRTITIRGSSTNQESFESALDQVRVAMRIRHKLKPNEEEDFGLVSSEEINSIVKEFVGAVAMVITPVTLISLVVAGVVIMNIMLVSVTERTFEIGLRKALGGRRRDILYQFLIESFFLASLGGLLGLGLASIIARTVEVSTPIPMRISAGYIILAIGVSGGIGIICGIYPAMKASKLDPIVAIAAER
ncbi:ABC transporter permease [Acidobacteria bacterium AH-259-L09]|nr:ABC transporter permease [Acidobacteria bacterium AH-259-L09]